MKKCPYCAEEVQEAAVVCKHCHREINKQPVVESTQPKRFWTLGKLVALCVGGFILLLIIITSSGVNVETVPETQPAAVTPLVLDTAQSVPYEVVKVTPYNIKAISGKLSDNTTTQLQQAPTNKRTEYRIVVAAGTADIQVKHSINKVIVDVTKNDPDLDEVDVLVYDNKKDANSIYTVGRGTWASGGTWGSTTPSIASSNDRSTYAVKYDIVKK